MSKSLDCPGDEYWQALLEGPQQAAEQEFCERHLSSCPDCQARLDKALANDTALLQPGRQFGDPTQAPADPAVARIIERLVDTTSSGGLAHAEPDDLYFLRPADRPGVLGFLDEYEILEVIGRGGMGLVLKAFDPALRRLVAIKVIAAAGLVGSATARRRFRREVQAAACVCHDHVVTVHGVHEADGLPYLVMQYVAGESLQERLDRTGQLDVMETIRIGRETALGLAAAHAQGLIHRDIKPANLLLEIGQDRVRITDFGLARMANDVQLTQDGVVTGTPEYMAPEQARGESVDHRADLFSLGSVLYAMCAGRPPYQGLSAVAVLRQVSDEQPKPLRALNPGVPPWLEALIGRLMAKDPSERIQSATETATLLECCRAHLEEPEKIAAPKLLSVPSEETGQRKKNPVAIAKHTMSLLRRAPGLFLLMALGFGFASWFAGCGGNANSITETADFYHDFRGKPVPPELTLFQVEKDELLQIEPEGARITLPKGWIHRTGGVGFWTAFGLKGDFDITTTFEVLHADTPPSGYGVGVCLHVTRKGRGAAGIARLILPRGVQAIFWDKYNAKLWGEQQGAAPCTDKVGRLRLKRTGTTLLYLWAPGIDGDNFQQIHQMEFFADDMDAIRLTALTGRTPSGVDARLLDLRVRGQLIATPILAAERGTLGAVLLVGMLVTLGFAIGAWLFVRRRRPAVLLGKEGAHMAQPEPVSVSGLPQAALEVKTKEQEDQQIRKTPLRQIALWSALVLALVISAFGFAAWFAGGGATEEDSHPEVDLPTAFYHDFRGNAFPSELEWYNTEPNDLAHEEPEGLRISLSKARSDIPGGVGIRTLFGFKGDFDVTTTFEILRADKPPGGKGVGLCLVLWRAGGGNASLSRVLRDDQVISWEWLHDGRVDLNLDAIPCPDKVGQLRLKRTGSVLYFLWAPGVEGGAFQEINKCNFGTGGIERIRLTLVTGRKKLNADLRLLDLRVKGQTGLTATIAAEKEPLPQVLKRGTLAGVLVLGWLITMALALALYLFARRRRSRAGQTTLESPQWESDS